MEKTVKVPMINIMVTLVEAQLFSKWVPFCSKSETIAIKSNFRQLFEFEYTLPWPLYKRGVFIQISGMPLPGEQAGVFTI
jgi:hypothetical protein